MKPKRIGEQTTHNDRLWDVLVDPEDRYEEQVASPKFSIRQVCRILGLYEIICEYYINNQIDWYKHGFAKDVCTDSSVFLDWETLERKKKGLRVFIPADKDTLLEVLRITNRVTGGKPESLEDCRITELLDWFFAED